MSRLICFCSSLWALCLRIELNRVEKNYIQNIWFWVCDIFLGSQNMNRGLSNLLSKVSMSKYAKFEVQWTRPSRFIPESWKSISKLHFYWVDILNLSIQLAKVPKTFSIPLNILVDLVIALLALSCMSSIKGWGLETVFCKKIDFKNYRIKVTIYNQLAWHFLSHFGWPYSSIVQSIGILHKPYKQILSNLVRKIYICPDSFI